MKTYSSNYIADFFRAAANPEYGDLISNLKLQKLCYYAAGLISAVRPEDAKQLFDESIQAWQHGPVIPSQYRRFSEYGAGDIPPAENFNYSHLDECDLDLLNDVYEYYGQYSAWKLRNMTHEESPWVNAFPRANKTISSSELREFFLTEVDDQYIEEYRAKAA